MSTTPVDLSTILFRSFQFGDIPPPSQDIPEVAASSTTPVVLDGIKFRSKQIGEVEE